MREFYQTLDSLNTTQLAALNSLASLAIQEKCSLRYKWQGWVCFGIELILPLEIIEKCEFYDPTLLKVVMNASVYLLVDLTSNEKTHA
jgi:hypothetical protein